MAIGIYAGAGGVKTVSGIYVGAGGVKTVSAVYVGAGSVKQVWPSGGLFDGGTTSAGGDFICTAYDSNSAPCPRVTDQGSYIRVYNGASNWGSSINGGYFSNSINGSAFSKLSMTFYVETGKYTIADTWQHTYIGACTSEPNVSTYGAITINGTDYNNYILANDCSTGSTYTVSVDISSVSSTLYIYIAAKTSNSSSVVREFDYHVTKVELS